VSIYHPDLADNTDLWRSILSGEDPRFRRGRRLRKLIPAAERCKNCHAPFSGVFGLAMRVTGRGRYDRNPRFCHYCLEVCSTRPGGAELELTLLFVDVRGSTALSETMNAAAFSALMNRFYAAATGVLIRFDAFVDKFVGDEVIAVFFPAFAGSDPAREAVLAAREMLRAVGHGTTAGPWLPVGVGVHTGVAYFGTVAGVDGSISDVTALGESVNVAARIVASAAAGEALISDAAYDRAGVDFGDLERRELDVRGRREPVAVRVLRASDRHE
jgi:adenylate cyclase